MRNMDRLMLAVLLAVFTSACTPQAATAPADGGAPARTSTPQKDAAPVASAGTQVPDTKAPDAASVLYMIYNKDGDGATSYEIENGSVATYWYGHAFELAGTRYFTGFAYDTPEKFEGDDGMPDPGQGVNLTHATFRHAGDAAKPWVFDGAELSIGEFGTREQANEVDKSRTPVSTTTPDGRYVLAVPTRSFENGVASTSFDVFAFQPGELQNAGDTHWRHLGTLAAGEDNGAACDDGQVMPCTKSQGELTFVAQGTGLPSVRIARTGSIIDAAGKTRELGAADTVTYSYDASKKAFIE